MQPVLSARFFSEPCFEPGKFEKEDSLPVFKKVVPVGCFCVFCRVYDIPAGNRRKNFS